MFFLLSANLIKTNNVFVRLSILSDFSTFCGLSQIRFSTTSTALFSSDMIGSELEAVQVHHGKDDWTPAGEEQEFI